LRFPRVYVLSFDHAVAILLRFYFRMPDREQGPFIARSLKFLQETLRRSGPEAAAGYMLIGAIGLFGALGYALDAWLGTEKPWFLLVGLLLGVVVGFFELAKIVFRK